jgi:cell division protein ZapA
MDRNGSRVVSVEIAGHRYAIRSDLDPEYVASLAAYVSDRIAAVSRDTSSDSVRIAVLAALNIADEYFRCRDRRSNDAGRLRERAEGLERLVDRALALQDAPPE